MNLLDEARIRAKRRKSPLNLLLIPAVAGPWFLLSWLTTVGFGRLHQLLHAGPEFAVVPEGPRGILMAVAPLFAWLAPAMIAGNLLVRTIPRVRRVLDMEATFVPGTDLRSANRGLSKVAFVLTPVALLVGFVASLA